MAKRTNLARFMQAVGEGVRCGLLYGHDREKVVGGISFGADYQSVFNVAFKATADETVKRAKFGIHGDLRPHEVERLMNDVIAACEKARLVSGLTVHTPAEEIEPEYNTGANLHRKLAARGIGKVIAQSDR